MKKGIGKSIATLLAAIMILGLVSGCTAGEFSYSIGDKYQMIADFEGLEGAEPPYGFAANSNGGTCEFALIDAGAQGDGAMQLSYNYDSKGYAGATLELEAVSLEGYDGLCMWCSTDGTGNSITVQIKDSKDKSWESIGYMNARGATEYFMPFDSFIAPSWDSSARDPFDPAGGILSVSVYTNRTGENRETGIIRFDAIRACDFSDKLADAEVSVSTKVSEITSFPYKIEGKAKAVQYVTLQFGSAQVNVPVAGGKWSYEVTEKDRVYSEKDAELFAFAKYMNGDIIAESEKQTVTIDVKGDYSDVLNSLDEYDWEPAPEEEIIDIATDEMIAEAKETLKPVMQGEKVSVLDFFYDISGKYTLSGIHNREPNGQPLIQTTEIVSRTGLTPGLWSGDFLFSAEDVENRWKMVYECEQQWQQGSIVQLMLHVTPPDMGEVGVWDGDVLSDLSDDEWESLITDGGELNVKWKARLDVYAEYLQYLEDKNVTVLFRPFHEMNQGAFWWGGRPGENGTAALYRLTHDYLTDVKGLYNIIWVWNMQDLDYNWSEYDPGSEYWEIFSVDFYNGDGFTTRKYETALEVAGDKPIGIGECDKLPTAEELKAQPRWAFFMSWAELTFSANDSNKIRALYNSDNVLVREELPEFN